MENTIEVPQKIKNKPNIELAVLLLAMYLRELEPES
jgi:hypothetical protein